MGELDPLTNKPVDDEWATDFLHQEITDLRAKLDTARSDLEDWDHLAALMRDREQPWIEQWQREANKPATLPDYGEMLGWLVAKLEQAERDTDNWRGDAIKLTTALSQAEARVRELEEALKLALDCDKHDPPACGCWIGEARAALTPKDGNA